MRSILFLVLITSLNGFGAVKKPRVTFITLAKKINSEYPLKRWQIEEELEYYMAQGKKGVFAIEIRQYGRDYRGSKVVKMKLYKTLYSKKEIVQSISFKKDAMNGLFPELLDMNNDGCLDIKIRTYEAARGGNEVCTLFIFDPIGDSLITVQNSWKYPNLRYNEKLDCIDAWALHGGSSTSFLCLKGDSLIKKVGIEVSEGEVIIDYYNSHEKKYKTIRKPTKLGEYTRFTNYQPLEIMFDLDNPKYL